MEKAIDKGRLWVLIIVMIGFLAHLLFLSWHLDRLISVNYKNELSSLNDAAKIIAVESAYFDGLGNMKYALKNGDIFISTLEKLEKTKDYGKNKKELASTVQRLTDNYNKAVAITNVYDFKKKSFRSASPMATELKMSSGFDDILSELKKKGEWKGDIDNRLSVVATYNDRFSVANFIIINKSLGENAYIQNQINNAINSEDGVYIFGKNGNLIAANRPYDTRPDTDNIADGEYRKINIYSEGKSVKAMAYYQKAGDLTIITTKDSSDISLFSAMMKLFVFVFLGIMVAFVVILTSSKSKGRELYGSIGNYERIPRYAFKVVSVLIMLIIISLSSIFMSQTLNLHFNNLFRETLKKETISVAKSIEKNKITLEANVDKLLKNSKYSLESTVQAVSRDLDHKEGIAEGYKHSVTDKSGMKVFFINKNEMLWNTEYRYIRDRYGGKNETQTIEMGILRGDKGRENEFEIGSLRQTSLVYNKKRELFVVAERVFEKEYIDKSQITGNISLYKMDKEGNSKNSIALPNMSGKIQSSSDESRIGQEIFAYDEGSVEDADILLKSKNDFYEYYDTVVSNKKITNYIVYTGELGKYVVGSGSYDIISNYNYSFSRTLTLITMATLFITVLSLTVLITIRTGKML